MPNPRKPRHFKPGKLAKQQKGLPVTAARLREIYHEARIEQRAATGELTTEERYNKHLDPPLEFEPRCTCSIRQAFLQKDGKTVAEVHFYRRPNGSIAASGLLDPKEVFHN
jgi:hypothetical protein